MKIAPPPRNEELVGTVDWMCLRGNHEVHRANKALNQLRFAFLS